MKIKRFMIGTLMSAISLSVTGYLLFYTLLPGFYSSFMNAGSATGVARQPVLWWAIAVGMLSYGSLIAVAVDMRAGSVTVGTGVTTGATLSFLMWFTADFMLYGIANVGNVTGVLVDSLLEAIPGAVAGGAAAAVLANIRGNRLGERRAA